MMGGGSVFGREGQLQMRGAWGFGQGPFGCGDKLLMERGSKFVLDRNGLFIFGEVG